MGDSRRSRWMDGSQDSEGVISMPVGSPRAGYERCASSGPYRTIEKVVLMDYARSPGIWRVCVTHLLVGTCRTDGFVHASPKIPGLPKHSCLSCGSGGFRPVTFVSFCTLEGHSRSHRRNHLYFPVYVVQRCSLHPCASSHGPV